MLLTIFWDFPNHIPVAGFELRFYSLMFIISFVLGQYGMQYVFKRENINPKWMDSLVYMVVGATIVGARLGHVFFYDWSYYKDHLGEIFMVWKGGLASHGAAIAITLVLIYWSRKIAKRNPLWILDRIVIVVALAAGFIRIGNWFNSEIYGAPANSATQTVYLEAARAQLIRNFGGQLSEVDFEPTNTTLETDTLNYPILDATLTFNSQVSPEQALGFTEDFLASIIRRADPDDRNIWVSDAGIAASLFEDANGHHVQVQLLGVPRYPTQLYEALGYWFIFLTLVFLYFKTNAAQRPGALFGSFLVALFGFRFFIEFLKEIQVGFEQSMALNMGQWLSIPLVLTGLYFILTSKRKSL